MLLIFLAAILFYAVLPLVGAWRVKLSWKAFRASAIQALDSPEVDFSSVQTPPPDAVRLTGTLEAFEGNDRLWVGNRSVSLAVSLRGVPVYFLDNSQDPFGTLVEPPRRVGPGSLGALAEGTQFLVWGKLTKDHRGQAAFVSRPDHPLLVIAFEGDPHTVLTRVIFAGRPLVDHWNAWTPVTVGVGFLMLLVLSYVHLRTLGDRSAALVGLALALLPSTFFLPPGILLFYGFSRLWSQARHHRAWTDVSRLGGGEGSLAQKHHRRAARWQEAVAQGLLAVGVASNAVVLAMLLHWWKG